MVSKVFELFRCNCFEEYVLNSCTSPLRLVDAKAEQTVINGYETAKQACFAVKKSKYCSFCKCVS